MRRIHEKVTYLNDNGKSVEIKYAFPYFLQEFIGADGLDTQINKYKYIDQDGTTIDNLSLQDRPLQIIGIIKARNKNEAAKYRRELLQVFNPKSTGTIIYEYGNTKKQIKCRVESAPKFKKRNRTYKRQDFLIDLIAPNPYWQDVKETETNLVSWIPNLEFIEGEGFYTEQSPNYWLETGDPFEEFQSGFGTGEGIEFGYREINQIVEIENTGDVDSPIKVVFRAIGDVVNPLVQNMETKEMLRINKTLKMNDKLEITTGFGNKNIYLNGEKAHHYLDFLNSTWLQLSPGINLIKYDAEHGLNNLECTIYYTPQYLGV